MIKRLGLLALVAGTLAACNETTTEPATLASFSAATRATTPLSAPALPTLACPATSSSDQISTVLDRISASNLSATVKAQITASVQHALTALSDRDLTAAVTALQSALATLEASNAPQPVKDAVTALLNCLITQLSA
jgi:hypothetical protein